MRQIVQTLEDYRREIDQIDTALHDLLIRRTEISQAIAKVKQADGSAPVMRPAREAAILRRLLARHRGDLPAAVVVRIWREIIAASLRSQTAFHLHVYGGDDPAPFLELAQGYFGALTPTRTYKRALQVIHACGEEPNSVGLVPVPESEEAGPAWWAQLAPAGERGPRIVAKLPFVTEGEDAPAAFGIGAIEHEPTGDDTTLLLLEIAPGLSRKRLQTLLKEAGFDAKLIAAGRLMEKSVPDELLLEIAGFVPAGDPRLAKLAEAAGEAIVRARPIGGYANPVVLAKGRGK